MNDYDRQDLLRVGLQRVSCGQEGLPLGILVEYEGKNQNSCNQKQRKRHG